MYAAAASQWFLEEVGFQHIERVLLPRAALHLPSLAKVPAAAYIFEITPSVNGTRTPRRMVPRTLSDLLAQPDRVPADTTPEIQEFHLPVYHAICSQVEENLFQ